MYVPYHGIMLQGIADAQLDVRDSEMSNAIKFLFNGARRFVSDLASY
jgi:hypothetical protein